MNYHAIPLVAFLVTGCAVSPDFSQRLENSLRIMQLANDDQIARNAAINQSMRGGGASVMQPVLMNQSINGNTRYCKYSNGEIRTFAVTSMCPYNPS